MSKWRSWPTFTLVNLSYFWSPMKIHLSFVVSSFVVTDAWGGGQMPSRGPPRSGISWNAYQICHHESNHWYSRWMCSAWDGSNNCYSQVLPVTTSRAYARGELGVKTPPLSLIFCKIFITCAKEIEWFHIVFACYFVVLMQIPRNSFACKFQWTL